VLPKILACRVPGKDAVEDVVRGLAAKKPQKLRQIGLNYGLAHAKGYFENEDKERVGKPKTEEEKEEPAEGGKDSSSIAAAPTSADTLASTGNDPTPASTATSSTASPETKAQASKGPIDKEDASSPPPAPIPLAEAAAEAPETSPPDSKSAPWNAVCVIGLRVYSKDAEVSVKLVKPRDAEEGAALDADGLTPAGPTT